MAISLPKAISRKTKRISNEQTKPGIKIINLLSTFCLNSSYRSVAQSSEKFCSNFNDRINRISETVNSKMDKEGSNVSLSCKLRPRQYLKAPYEKLHMVQTTTHIEDSWGKSCFSFYDDGATDEEDKGHSARNKDHY